MRYRIGIRSKHTGADQTLAIVHDNREAAETYAKAEICQRCNSYWLIPMVEESIAAIIEGRANRELGTIRRNLVALLWRRSKQGPIQTMPPPPSKPAPKPRIEPKPRAESQPQPSFPPLEGQKLIPMHRVTDGAEVLRCSKCYVGFVLSDNMEVRKRMTDWAERHYAAHGDS